MIVDLECDIPTREVREADVETYQVDDEGMANYLNIFGSQWAEDAGMSLEEFQDRKQIMKPMDLRREIAARAVETALTPEQFLALLDAAGITVACIGTEPEIVFWSRVSRAMYRE